MRTLFGAFLTLAAVTPALLTPATASAQINADAGVQPQAEDRVPMGPPGRPAPQPRDDRGDRGHPEREDFGNPRPDRGTPDRGTPDRGTPDRDRADRGPGQGWGGDRPQRPDRDPDRGPARAWNGDRPDRGRVPGRPGDDGPRPPRIGDRGDDWARSRPGRRADDWTRSRLDRRDDRWARSRFEDRAAWNRGWRGDRRYDWNGYRSDNREAYRLPRYYAPYGWGGGYRRFGIGNSLQTALWGRNYWIADPYAYRLPEAYGPYRWVRYYDDALLVDLRSGLVVDAVYGIFW